MLVSSYIGLGNRAQQLTSSSSAVAAVPPQHTIVSFGDPAKSAAEEPSAASYAVDPPSSSSTATRSPPFLPQPFYAMNAWNRDYSTSGSGRSGDQQDTDDHPPPLPPTSASVSVPSAGLSLQHATSTSEGPQHTQQQYHHQQHQPYPPSQSPFFAVMPPIDPYASTSEAHFALRPQSAGQYGSATTNQHPSSRYYVSTPSNGAYPFAAPASASQATTFSAPSEAHGEAPLVSALPGEHYTFSSEGSSGESNTYQPHFAGAGLASQMSSNPAIPVFAHADRDVHVAAAAAAAAVGQSQSHFGGYTPNGGGNLAGASMGQPYHYDHHHQSYQHGGSGGHHHHHHHPHPHPHHYNNPVFGTFPTHTASLVAAPYNAHANDSGVGGAYGDGHQQQAHHRAPFFNPFEVKHRRRTTRLQFKVLESTFVETSKPSAATRKMLSEQLDMPLRAVQIWFQNRRAKAKAQARKGGVASTSTSGSGGGGGGGGVHSSGSVGQHGSPPPTASSSSSSSFHPHRHNPYSSASGLPADPSRPGTSSSYGSEARPPTSSGSEGSSNAHVSLPHQQQSNLGLTGITLHGDQPRRFSGARSSTSSRQVGSSSGAGTPKAHPIFTHSHATPMADSFDVGDSGSGSAYDHFRPPFTRPSQTAPPLPSEQHRGPSYASLQQAGRDHFQYAPTASSQYEDRTHVRHPGGSGDSYDNARKAGSGGGGGGGGGNEPSSHWQP